MVYHEVNRVVPINAGVIYFFDTGPPQKKVAQMTKTLKQKLQKGGANEQRP